MTWTSQLVDGDDCDEAADRTPWTLSSGVVAALTDVKQAPGKRARHRATVGLRDVPRPSPGARRCSFRREAPGRWWRSWRAADPLHLEPDRGGGSTDRTHDLDGRCFRPNHARRAVAVTVLIGSLEIEQHPFPHDELAEAVDLDRRVMNRRERAERSPPHISIERDDADVHTSSVSTTRTPHRQPLDVQTRTVYRTGPRGRRRYFSSACRSGGGRWAPRAALRSCSALHPARPDALAAELPYFSPTAVESTANILLFVPLAFLIGLAWRRPVAAALVAIAASAAIEAVQAVVLAVGRACDTSDLITNAIAAVLGGLCAWGALLIRRMRDARKPETVRHRSGA